MRRLFAIAASVAILLLLLAPAALAAEPATGDRGFVLAVNGAVDVPAGDHLDTVVVVNGQATVSGSVDTIVVIRGTAMLTGATAGSLVVIDGTADLGSGTTVLGDVRTLRGNVSQQPGAVVQGSVRTLDADLAAFALLIVPLFIVLFIGIAMAAILAAILVAALAARQVREMESLISREPGHVLIAGILGSVALTVLAILLIMTIVGAPVGLALLLLVLPAIAFLGWIVAAIWIGDWLIDRMRGAREPDRPIVAAVLGVVVLAAVGVLPFVSAIATLFGLGALLLAAWRTLSPQAPAVGQAGTTWVAPSAG